MSKPSGGYSSQSTKPSGGYSSQSYNPASNKPRSQAGSKSYPKVATNPALLKPMDPKVDPKDQTAKTKEKEQMVGLNDKFVAFIEKKKSLEDQNRKLDTKLKILLEQEDYKGKIPDLVNQMENELRQQIDQVDRDRFKLEAELVKQQDEVDQTRRQYEDELIKKNEVENEFVYNKKEVDEGHLGAVELALELEDLMGELEFLKRGYDEEIKELESQVQNETVVIREESKRSLDMDDIIDSAKAQYSNMAAQAREEVDQWNQTKMDDLMQTAGKRESDVRDMKKEIADLIRLIQRLNGELEALKKKKDSVCKDITDTELEGQKNLDEARENIVALEEALKRAKQDMALQLREYSELMNLKLALDIEIATYRKLLEGEEQRMSDHIRQQQYDDHAPLKPQPVTKSLSKDHHVALPTNHKKRLLVRVEVEEGRVVSQSSHYTDVE